MTLKDRFLEAVSNGELGEVDDHGVIVSLKQFKSYFQDVTSDYVNSFLPAAVIETGQLSTTQTKYLFRVRKGVYRVHPDAIDEFKAIKNSVYSEMPDVDISHMNNKVEEALFAYNRFRLN